MIEIQREAGVETLRLNRPAKKNALTGEMYTALAEALERGNADPEVRVHLVCGVPGAFTSGNDIADFLAFAADGNMADAPVVRFLRALAACETPIVAAVDGLAIGVGTTMLFHCDMVFASPRAFFKTPFIDLGLVPEAGASLLAPARMGHSRAFELLCLGESFDPVMAKAAGFGRGSGGARACLCPRDCRQAGGGDAAVALAPHRRPRGASRAHGRGNQAVCRVPAVGHRPQGLCRLPRQGGKDRLRILEAHTSHQQNGRGWRLPGG